MLQVKCLISNIFVHIASSQATSDYVISNTGSKTTQKHPSCVGRQCRQRSLPTSTSSAPWPGPTGTGQWPAVACER